MGLCLAHCSRADHGRDGFPWAVWIQLHALKKTCMFLFCPFALSSAGAGAAAAATAADSADSAVRA